MKKAKLFMMLALLVMGVSNVFAQNVTIRPDNGNMLANKKTGGRDTFFRWKGFSTWKHEQLSLTMTTGDSNNNLNGNNGTNNPLTSSGQLQNPANDIFVTDKDSNNKQYLQIGKGNTMDTYLTVSLPKGYRFTGYTIRFHRINAPSTKPNGEDAEEYGGSISFGETDNKFAFTNYESGIAQNDENQYDLIRNSDTEMGNVLYFRLSNNKNDGRAFIQLDHIEFRFTAEANYIPLIPAPTVNGRSAVDISFLTGKLDYGTIEEQTDANDTRMGYGGKVYELNGKLTLFEDGSVTEDKNNGYDGTVGKLVDYKAGSISTSGDYFKLEASKHGKYKSATEEVIYYIESPIWATLNNNETSHKHPIGYRIVGASFDYAGGTGNWNPAIFKIQYTDDGVTYGLNYYNTQYNLYNQSDWRIDKDGYIYYGVSYYWTTYTLYLAVDGTDIITTYNKPSAGVGTFEIVDNNGVKQIRLKGTEDQYIGWEERTTSNYWGKTTTTWVPVIVTGEDGEDHRSTYNEQSAGGYSESVGQYTINVYDKTGTRVIATKTVNGNTGTLPVNEDYNNDAIKIGIIGTALIKGNITMQALDPYIDRLDIVCQENGGNGGRLTQQFTSTDFSVKGGKFTFYAPQDFEGDAKFSFENLYSSWGDNTYYNANNNPENHARYSFVWSPYYKAIAEGTQNVYDTDPEADYKTKVYTEYAGTAKYKFNNAEEVGVNGGIYKEYPFNPNRYAVAENCIGNKGGEFAEFVIPSGDFNSGNIHTAYLFTCDETRYNIAPTTGTQHTYYAYYQMDIDMRLKDYRPTLVWEKIYDPTYYSAEKVENGKKTHEIKTDAKWGLTLSTTETIDDNGEHSGYLTLSQIQDAIQNGLPEIAAVGTPGSDGYIPKQEAVQGLDATGKKAPKTMDQILYIDGHKLMSIIDEPTSKEVAVLDETGEPVLDEDNNPVTKTEYESQLPSLKANLDKNALIYLPYGTTSTLDNFATNTIAKYNEDPIFFAGKDIVISDIYPFFAPFDIQVDAANLLKYDRALTPAEGYNNIVNATVILPFTIDVTNGVHNPMAANDPGLTSASPFTLSTMNEGAALAKVKSYNYGTESSEHVAYFNPIEGKTSKANVPYVVTIDNVQDGDYNFHVRQKGATVVATPPSVNDNSTTNGIFTGTPSEGTVDGTDYTLTPTGTYMGKIIDKAKSVEPAVFYFSKDLFLTTRTMTDKQSLKIYPFRSFYEYPAPVNAKMTSFRIVFGENDEMGGTNGIDEIQRDADLAVIPGSRSITLMARADKNVTIHAVNGQTVDKCNLRAGETRTVSVPAGVYVINGVKMVVK